MGLFRTDASVNRGLLRARAARGSRAFTLVEVMMGTLVICVAILGALSVYIASYQIAARTRYRDHARYVIKSLADQFLTQSSSDSNGNTMPIFIYTGVGNPTGTGLSFIDANGVAIQGTSSGMTVAIGDNVGSAIPLNATVTREVCYMTTTGGTATTAQNASAGYLLQGTFSISYRFQTNTDQTFTQKLTVVRAVP